MRHNYLTYLIITLLFFDFSCRSVKREGIVINDLNDSLVFEIIDHKEPVINRGDPGTEENRYGFEGGTVIKMDGMYQMFTAEMVDLPWATKMKLAHWRSRDGIQWERVSTLYESSGNYDGTDPRASLWAPMPYYNKDEGRWNLFYVAYKSQPNNDIARLHNYEGRIWRAVSGVPGEKGYGGPYKDAGVILEPDAESEIWEGLGGTNSFYAYEANSRFYAFYGSCHLLHVGPRFWAAGLASAPTLAGPWKRCPELSPLEAGTNFVENLIVTKLDDGSYIGVFDCGGRRGGGFGYILSKDGVHWSKAHFVKFQPVIPKWYVVTRTPLCLIKEADGTYTTFYTAFTGSHWADFAKNNGFAALGMVRFRLSNPNQK
jgi:hypothetical protein